MSKRSEHKGDPTGDGRKVERARARVDPKRARALDKLTPDKPAVAEKPRKIVTGSDPYNQVRDKPQGSREASRRRSLDDMRRLSEAIKAAPKWTPPQKAATSALYRRLDELRAELQRILAEIQGLREGVTQDAAGPMVELTAQLREGARHLEEAIAYLVPPQE